MEELGAGKPFWFAPWPPCSVTSVVRPYWVFGFRPCRGCFASPGLRPRTNDHGPPTTAHPPRTTDHGPRPRTTDHRPPRNSEQGKPFRFGSVASVFRDLRGP